MDTERLMAEDEALITSDAKGPWRFGVNHEADLSTENSGTWTTLADGTQVWRLTLHCPDATSINFVFGAYHVPEGARVFVWNEAGEILGAFTQASSGGSPSMGVSPLAGDRITIQYECPPGTSRTGALRITQVTHGYRGIGAERGLGDSDACNNNVICPEGDPWRDPIASVAMIVVNGNGLCTGQLVNTCANNGTPYFLTANHCLTGSPTNWTFRFGWDSPLCDPTGAGITTNTVSGATLLESDAGSDVALLLLNTPPPASYNVWYTGWDATGTRPSATTAIHHPSGDVKKISFDQNAPLTGEFNGAECWHILGWDDGTTEGGSSGGGLWNDEGRLIGQLFGGQASCTNNVNDWFGRFDLSYPLLTTWLGNCGTPVIDGFDPNAPAVTLDASLLAITGVETNYCDMGELSPSITFRNNGATILTALTITCGIDGQVLNTTEWMGNVAPGATATLALPMLTVASGTHVLQVGCSSPNGGMDGNAANDAINRGIHVADPGEPVTLTIDTDDFGSETIWTVESEGVLLYHGGPYADVGGGTTETATFCLAEGCFTFTIMDAAGDGICCGWGEGDYSISDSSGTVLLDGDGNFNTVAISQFCTSDVAIAETEDHMLPIHPLPSYGPITIQRPWPGDLITINVFDQLGRRVHTGVLSNAPTTTLDLSHLAPGRYLLDAANGMRRAIGSAVIVR